MINLTFGTLHAGQSSKIEIFWVNAQNTGFIVPKISFVVGAFAFHCLNVERLLIWTMLTFVCIVIVHLALITLIADGALDEERLRFWT